MSSALPPIPPDIARIAGPLLLGHILNWFLFGLLSAQIYVYHLAFPKDSRHSKILVYFVYLLEVVQTLLLVQTAWHSFAAGFGNLIYLDEIGTIWFSVPIIIGIVACVAQTFYAYRISILAQSKIVPSFIVLLAFISLGGAIATGIESKRAVYTSHFLGKKSYITTGIWNGGSALCDVIIAVCMTVYLSRRNTGIPETTRLLKKITRLTVETGTVTAIVALLNFALALAPGHPTYYMTTAGILGKLYSNSMMVVFNSRVTLEHNVSHKGYEVRSALIIGGPQSRVSDMESAMGDFTTRSRATRGATSYGSDMPTEYDGKTPLASPTLHGGSYEEKRKGINSESSQDSELFRDAMKNRDFHDMRLAEENGTGEN